MAPGLGGGKDIDLGGCIIDRLLGGGGGLIFYVTFFKNLSLATFIA